MTQLTRKDVQTIRSALNRAIDERLSLADAYSNQGPEAEEALALVSRYEKLHAKIFGEPSDHVRHEAYLKAQPMKTIQEIARDQNEKAAQKLRR